MAVFRLSEWFGSFWSPRRSEDKEGGRTVRDADRRVSIDSALQMGTVWSCVRLLSETIGTLPLGVFRREEDGGRASAPDHWLYALLHDSPNADMTAAEFWEAAVACLCLWGNFYAEIKRNSAGEIVALNFLAPDKMKVSRNEAGARVYTYNNGTRRRDIAEARVFHIRGFGAGGDIGLSPIGYARKTLSLAIDTDLAASTAMRNGVRPAGFLVVPGKPTPEQKKGLRETFIDPVTGPEATAKAGILEQGMDWKDAKGLPPEDLQLIQGRAFNVEEICRWFRVPPFMIGHTEKSTSWGTGLEQQMIGFLTFSLRPYLTRIEQAVKKQLIAPAERAAVYAEFNLEGLLRADSAGRAALYNTFAQNGISTRNEIRARENLPKVTGGDALTVQSNLVPLDQLGAVSDADRKARAAVSWLVTQIENRGGEAILDDQPKSIEKRGEKAMQRKHGALKVRDFDLQVKAVEDDGSFSGYGSVFGVVDSYNEIVAPGAFADSLKEIAAKGRPVPVLWQHRSGQPIGVWADLKEDDRGLYGTGSLLIDAVALAKEAHALMKAGAVSGLSIGYWIRESSYDEKTGIRTLTKLDLVEISLVTFPANDDARIDAIKMKLAHGQLPTMSEFERLLREAGFSKSQSAVIANRGLNHLLRSESEGSGEKQADIAAMKTMLDGFSLPTL